MKRTIFCLIVLLAIFGAKAQKNGVLKGVLMDTSSHHPVSGATLTIMNRSDSSLVSFSMSDNAGRFEIRFLPKGSFRLLVTHVNYHNIDRKFNLSDSANQLDLGDLVMVDKATLLQEVVVTAEAPPVTMIDDTIQYNAGSFKVQPNATVEDMLKKLPGVKVEKDGTIKAQGEKVQKVLVDGKEFFGNDPKIATRNLPADAIDKVQVYDKMSEQAQLTGFDDGNSEKTINLKLKKDKKKGVFGKVMAGEGTDKRYEGRFNVNSFKGARQMSIIGMGNNDNAEGFSFLDMLNFTGEMNRLRQGGNGGNISISMNSSEGGMMGGLGSNSTGINTTRAGGINYNNIIGKKTDLQSNYFFNHSNPFTETSSARQYFLQDSSYFSNQHTISDNYTNSHRVNINADILLDSFQSLRITPSFGFQESNTANSSDYENLSEQKQKSVAGYSKNIGDGKAMNFRNDLLYRKKFRTKGRTFSISLQNSFNNASANGKLESVNSFYDQTSGLLQKRDSINQKSNTSSDLNGFSARMAYTEPLSRRSLLELSLSRSSTHSTSSKQTFDYDKFSSQYDKVNKLLTNDYNNLYQYSQIGLRIRNQQKKYNYFIGANWQKAGLEGKIITGLKDSLISKQFVNLLPVGRFQYYFTRYRNLTVNYSTNTTQPTAQQLQPVPDNTNPLNIKVGNPELKQEYTQQLNLHFSSVNPFKNRNLFFFLNFSKTDNKIVNQDDFSGLVKTSKPVNVDGIYNMIGDISIGFPVRPLKGNINISTNAMYFQNKQIVKSVINTSKTFSTGPNIRLDMSLTENLTVNLNGGINYNHTVYTLSGANQANYLSQNYGSEIDWQLPSKFYFSTDFNYLINNQLASGFNAKVPLWNASISRQVLKFNRGQLKLRVYDLLNQNLGIGRNSNQNYIEDIRQVNLKRFFLLSFTYSLNKANGEGAASVSGMKIIAR